ncbi:MAG TPA: hypothetical protein PLO61_10950 [Fimbriimonadaceae bacterium]|nr:hypothetical protein [Fimbriimonadaceae bacterium]HRJ32126.1 hypothetical protein [Fimbriimonadaceae bacterium]
MMKKLIQVFAVLALLGGVLAGCGKKEQAVDPADPNLSKNTGEPVMGGPGGDAPSSKPK